MITKLTKEQEAQISVYIQKWIDAASEPIDREKAITITKELFGEDKTVLVANSIQNAVDIVRFIADGKEVKYSTQLDSQLGTQLRNQLDSQLHTQLYSQLGSQLGTQLHTQLDTQLGNQLRSQLDSQLESQLYTQLRNQLDSQLSNQLGSQLYTQLDSQLYSQLYTQLGTQLRSQLYTQLDSQLESQGISYSYYTTIWWYSWYGYYDFAKSIGVEFDQSTFNRMGDIILNIPLIITLGNILIVVDKPQVRWNNGRIHSDNLPAIEWPDNTGIYLLNGVRFEKELWERVVSKEMPFDEILAIKDIDQRTQAMRYGDVEKFLEYTNAKTLDEYTKLRQDGSPIHYRLVEIPTGETSPFTETAYYVIYDDRVPTGRLYMSGVPKPRSKDKATVAHAMSWKQSSEDNPLSPHQWKLLVPGVNEA